MNLDELPSGPFLVDNMRDEASRAYGAHPERLYIILDGRIVYQVKFQYYQQQIDISFIRVVLDLGIMTQRK